MILLNLGIILLVIIVVLFFHKPLYVAMVCGMVATAFLFSIDVKTSMELVSKGFTNNDTITIVLVMYLITYIQRMLESKQQLIEAQKNLYGIFNNRRINASIGPILIGLLPSAAVINICAEIVDNACGDWLDNDEKTFVTSFFRHIPEAFLPTFPSVLLLVEISGVDMGQFIIGMTPLAIALYLIGYVFFLRKVPTATGMVITESRSSYGKKLLKNIWSLALIIFLIIAFHLPAYVAVLISIVLSIIYYKFSGKEVIHMLKTAVEFQMLLNSALVMVFREFLQYTGAFEELPGLLMTLPLPTYIIFAFIFFVGAVLIGNNAIVAMTTGLAFATIPNGKVYLAILLMSFAYAAMQISPTHYCLFIATEYFKTEYGALVRKTIVPIAVFGVIALVYYNILTLLG